MFCCWQQLFVQCLCQPGMMKGGKPEKRQITRAKSDLEIMIVCREAHTWIETSLLASAFDTDS
ncbi:MAG TPA: hypothetical protein VGN95_19750 [Pyrinomonadaceae bacterium]|jgi:hypothetical protein|nr:hypothetical protein [Pyrinomonadaceae bacterium]